jgi:hypothetical protein
MQQIVVQTNTTTRIFLSQYTHLITGGSWGQNPKDHNNRVSQATGRPTESPARLPTDGPAMPPSSDSGRRLRCVAGFLDARERGSVVVARALRLLTKRMKFEMRCFVVIPLSLPCLLDSILSHPF